MYSECKDCGEVTQNRHYCNRCIDEDCATTDAWEQRQVARCDQEPPTKELQ